MITDSIHQEEMQFLKLYMYLMIFSNNIKQKFTDL